jgi:hypothetical protein
MTQYEAQQRFVSAKPPPHHALSGTILYLPICFAFQANYLSRPFYARPAEVYCGDCVRFGSDYRPQGHYTAWVRLPEIRPVHRLMLIISPSR